MKVTRFEDLRCWRSARELVKLVFDVSTTGKLAKDFETKFQFKKAALSTMNNIAEGFGRHGTNDSIRFYDISQSSAIEVESMTYVLADLEYLPPEKVNEIRAKAEETRSRTLAFIRYLRSKSTSTRQHINTSTRQHVNTSTHQHV
jgi:four helix bundle protein